MTLKELLFFRTNAEYEAYIGMNDSYSEEEKEHQKGRFLSAYQIIEEAELEDEYQAWKEAQGE